MIKEFPQVTIVMATYNRGHLIKEALDSIKNQTYQKWECLIIDDGSTDKTFELVKAFQEIDERFKYYRRTKEYKKGLPGSRNMGLDYAKGNYIIFFDDDDLVHPRNLEINTEMLINGNYCFCRYDKSPFTISESISFDDPRERPVSREITLNKLSEIVKGVIPFASCTVMWKKDCIAEERFNEELQYAEEWEFYTRILSKGVKGVSIKNVLYFNRKHANSNTAEYWQGNTKRLRSKIYAAELIIENLADKKVLTDELAYYFIRLSFFLKESSLLKLVLEHSQLSWLEKLKYRVGSKFYRLLRPLFELKGKIIQ